MTRLTVPILQSLIGVTADGKFGPLSKAALRRHLTNTAAPAITNADIAQTAQELAVDVRMIKAVRKVEAPRGAYDGAGLITLLYERHKFRDRSEPPGAFNRAYPLLSGSAYGPGGYGPYSAQFDRFASACALDPQAAFEACSWGAFQVLGENWQGCKYPTVFDMVTSLVASEAAQLDSFARFVRMKRLEDELRACRPGMPDTCRAFVKGYNGAAYERFNYHVKLSDAALHA